MENVLFSILWLVLLILFIWYISGLVAWLYILLLPFVACIPALDPLVQILLKIVQFPLVAGKNIRDGKLGLDETAVAATT